MNPERIGPYRILAPLGSGGMGQVYLAEDSRLGRQVALKVLSNAADRVAIDRFLREAKTTAALQHPNIAVLLDVGEQEGVPYLVLERIDGHPLRDELETGPLSWQRVLDIAAQIASALHHAHALGVLHRDIKPANIMLSPSRGAVLLDFGLVHWLRRPDSSDPASRPTETSAGLTREGTIAGTAMYMSADQLRGEPLDARSDLFQLGIVLYEALSGHHPFDGQTVVDVQHAILHDTPPPLPDEVPDELKRVVQKLIEKDPDFRYPDARALTVDLRALRRDSSTEGVLLPGPTTGRRPRTATRILGWGLAVAALASIVALLVGGPEHVRTPRVTPARFVPLTQGGSDEGRAAFSPDGKSVAFTSDRGGGWDLWVALVSGGTPVQITRTPEAETQPSWSPDGERMAFTRRRATGSGNDVFIMPALGGDARKRVEDASDPAWSPEGKRIAFSESSAGWTRIATIEVDGRAPPLAVTELEEGYFHRAPTWTPDGTTIVYVRSPGGSAGQLMRIPADGGTPVAITKDALGVANLDPDVTPDGREVVHVSDRGGAFNLWSVPIRGGEPHRITSGAGSDLSPSVSPDGARIAFTLSPRSDHVLAMSPDDGATTILSELGGSQAWGPDLAPDGSAVAFSLKVPGTPWRLVTLPRDGGSWKTVLDGLPDLFGARFLPDGRALLFHSRLPQGRRIGKVNVDGTDLAWLTREGEDASYPAISPDGASIAFVRNDGMTDTVVVRPLDDGQERIVARNATLPEFSPDGRRLTIARARSYTGGIGVVDLPDGEPRWLTETGTWPTWMPDSVSVAYADGGPDGNQQAWVVPVDAGPPRRLSREDWSGPHWPFVIDPRSGELITSDSADTPTTIWLAEY